MVVVETVKSLEEFGRKRESVLVGVLDDIKDSSGCLKRAPVLGKAKLMVRLNEFEGALDSVGEDFRKDLKEPFQ